MIDEVIDQVLGSEGLAAIIKPGNKVVIKVNLVGPSQGKTGEQGRGIITDPRIVRYVAEKVRTIIGFEGESDLKVVDGVFYRDPNPSLKSVPTSFYWGRLERNNDDQVDEADVCYDLDADGILDGTSQARLVNLDSLDETQRFTTRIKVNSSEDYIVCLPKFLRTRQEAADSGNDVAEYCDVLIGLPIFKSHGLCGITGAIKLHYGFRSFWEINGDTGKYQHNGLLLWDVVNTIQYKPNLLNYLCAEHLVRSYDLVIMDCLTGNRRGPQTPGEPSLYMPEPVDYILTNALLASRDSVAIDTVETLFAGYDPQSVSLLAVAAQNHLGTNLPQLIDLIGQDAFGKHRQALYNLYHPLDRYPFQDGWGQARIQENLNSTYTVDVKEPVLNGEKIYYFEYQVQDQSGMASGLARAELWINNKRIAYHHQGNLAQGRFMVDLAPYLENLQSNSFYVVIWDQLFNCSISPKMSF
jgi:uncharacterized protein (DUF362 family)